MGMNQQRTCIKGEVCLDAASEHQGDSGGGVRLLSLVLSEGKAVLKATC